MGPYLLDDHLWFPPTHLSTDDGLLAVGGDLSAERLILAYKTGIFPWFNSDDDVILWWSPDPRMVLYPEEVKVSKSMRSFLRKTALTVTTNQDFTAVIRACAAQKRKDQDSTWITEQMILAYIQLHEKVMPSLMKFGKTTHS